MFHYITAVDSLGEASLGNTRTRFACHLRYLARRTRTAGSRRSPPRSHGSIPGGNAKERDLSWLDYSYPADLSADGKTPLFDEEGIGGGVQYGDAQDLTYAVYIRNTDGTPAIRLGEGGCLCPLARSEMGHRGHAPISPGQLRLLPTGAGETQSLTTDNINHQWARWFPDGKRFVFSGNEPGRGVRFYSQDIAGGKPKAISPEGVDAQNFAISPDGQSVLGIGPDQKGYLLSSRRAVSLDLSMAWTPETFPLIGVKTAAPFIFTAPAKCRPKFIDWN